MSEVPSESQGTGLGVPCLEVWGTFPGGDTGLEEEEGLGRKAVTFESANKQGLELCLYYFKNYASAVAALYINLERKCCETVTFKQ